ncbi:MAG: ferredoxin [Nocardioides sp.]
MRLEIDWTRCDGHGLCARLLPESVTLDEHGFPVIPDRHVDDATVRHARRAVAACPRLALRLEPEPAPHPATR